LPVDLIVCEQAMDPARIRQHTDAMLLAGESLISVPFWGPQNLHWTRYRNWFNEESLYFLNEKGERARDPNYRTWYLQPSIEAMALKVTWFKAYLGAWDGCYLDMAGRGGMSWLRDGLKMPRVGWPLYQSAQSAAVGFFLEYFRRTLPGKLLVPNVATGPSKVSRARRTFGIRAPIYTSEMLRHTTGVSLEYPKTEQDRRYLCRAARWGRNNGLGGWSIAWGSDIELEDYVLAGELRKRETPGAKA
jgi:hypothetical protein